jgi:hypothetical protein
MAARTKTVSGNTSSYVITDAQGSTATVALTQGFGSGRTVTLVSTGGLHVDGQIALVDLLRMISTGLTP